VRDALSLEHVRAHLDRPVELSGDDAARFLRFPPLPVEPVVNFHVNAGAWVSTDPASMAGRIAGLLRRLAEVSPEPLELQPAIAYEDPRVSERRAVAAMLEEHGESLEAAGFSLVEPVDMLDDLVGNELRRFRRAQMTVACSYHVALASRFAGVAALLPADNEYYRQKAAGLRELFGREEGPRGFERGRQRVVDHLDAGLRR